MDGIQYDIDIHQDFHNVRCCGCPVAEMPVHAVVAAIHMADHAPRGAGDDTCEVETLRQDSGLWAAVDKAAKEERRAERKWKKDKKDRKERIKEFWKEMDTGEFFLSEKEKADLKRKWGVQDA